MIERWWALLVFQLLWVAPVQGAEYPNVVLIMADDLGYGDLSCYDGWIQTPAIDSIAARGMLMTDYHSNGNVCSPTRAALMTGRYQQRAGIPSVVAAAKNNPAHSWGLQPVENTIAEVLTTRGYQTGIFGKWHLGYFKKYNPTHHGFKQFVGYVSGNIDFISHVDQAGTFDWWHNQELSRESGYSTHLITQHAVEFIKDNQEHPFFLYVPHEAPHYPYQGPGDKADRTIGGEFNNHGSRLDKKEAYREMVEEMDKGVGDILSALKTTGTYRNTIVIFCSDNGATSLGSNGVLRGHKGTNFEGGHRVPCVVQWPGRISKGSRSDALMMSMDLMPTLLDCTGLSLVPGCTMDGTSMREIWEGEPAVSDRTVVWNGTTLRQGNWKLMLAQKGVKMNSLFNLENDKSESTNVIGKHPDLADDLIDKLNLMNRDLKTNATVQPSGSY